MIKLTDLRRVRKYCFNRIAQQSPRKTSLAVKFSPIGADMYECVMSNGEDYARIIAITTVLTAMPEFQISWTDFIRICDLFVNIIELSVKDNEVIFKEGKTKFKCRLFRSEANDYVNFEFDFDNAIKINMTDNLYIMSDRGNFKNFCLKDKYLMSTDGCFAAINILDNPLSDKEFLFTNIFPEEAWFFNPDYRIIVSEDKQMAMTIKKAAGVYPTKGILQLSRQALSNWFEVDTKEFIACLEKCAKVGEVVTLEFKKEGVLNITAEDLISSLSFETSIPCKIDHVSNKQKMKFKQIYLEEFYRCEREGKLKILFDDDPLEYKIRAEKDNLIIFAVGLTL